MNGVSQKKCINEKRIEKLNQANTLTDTFSDLNDTKKELTESRDTLFDINFTFAGHE